MKRKSTLPELPAMPAMPRLPSLPALPALAALPGEREEVEDEEVQVSAEAELDALQTEFQKRAKREDARLYDAVDSEYWVAFCFQTREQKDAFLRALDLFDDGDKYVDGYVAAEKLGVTLPDAAAPRKTRATSKKLTDLT